MSSVIGFPTDRALRRGEYEANPFGNCPVCERTPSFVNVKRAHANVCTHCNVFWWIGANLFSSWQHETEDDWRRNAALLDSCREVEPIAIPERE